MGNKASTDAADGGAADPSVAAAAPADEMKAVFDKLDSNHNGRLDKKEIADALKELGKSEQFTKDFLDGMKKDDVNFEEFKAAAAQVTVAQTPRGPLKAVAEAHSTATPATAPEAQPKEAPAAKEATAEADKKAGPATPQENGVRLYVQNLADDVTQAALRELFEPCGPVLSAHVRTKQGKPQGFGFVNVPANVVDKAIAAVNGKTVLGKALEVRIADSDKGKKGKGEGKGKDGKGKDAGKGKGKDGKGKEGKGKGAVIATQPMPYAFPGYGYPMMPYGYGYPYGYPAMPGYNPPAMPGYNPYAAYDPSQNPYAAYDPSQRVFEGSLKSIRTSGFGFVICAETYSLYNRDVYVDKQDLPEGSEVGSRIQFTVGVNEKGHPRATRTKLIPLS